MPETCECEGCLLGLWSSKRERAADRFDYLTECRQHEDALQWEDLFLGLTEVKP